MAAVNPVAAPDADYAKNLAQTDSEIQGYQSQIGVLQPKLDAERSAFDERKQTATLAAERGVQEAQDRQVELASQTPGDFAPPEVKPPSINPSDYQSLSYALIGMAAIAGGAKGNWMAASSALNGAMQGIVDGHQQQTQEYWKKYEAEYKTAMDKHNSAIKAYENTLKRGELTINQKLQAVRLTATEYGHTPEQITADQKSITELEKLVDSRRSARDKLEEAHAKITEQAKAAQQAHEDRRLQIELAHQDRQESLALREAVLKGGEDGLGSGSLLKNIIGRAAKKDATNDKVTGAGQAVAGLDGILERMRKDPQLLTGVQASLTNIREKAASAFGTDGEMTTGKLDQLINGAINPADKNAVFIKDALFAAFEAEKAAQGGRLTVQMMKQAGSALDPTSYTREGFVSVLGGRRQSLINNMRAQGLTDPEASKVVQYFRREQPGVSTTAPAAEPPKKNANGWVLHKDAAGNRAYVSPDGKQIEELK